MSTPLHTCRWLLEFVRRTRVLTSSIGRRTSWVAVAREEDGVSNMEGQSDRPAGDSLWM